MNPSLWRQSQLVVQGGLYEVVPGLYQVRTADLSNITIAEGDDGIVVFDPLISTETRRAPRSSSTTSTGRASRSSPSCYSHSHVDHYGGVARRRRRGGRAGRARSRSSPPIGFLEAAISENVLAGNVMSRRASYMYGNLLPADPKGQVGAGLGMTNSSGTVTLIPPTDHVTETGQRMKIDGLDFEFMLAPDTEAPAEMHWFIEQFKAVTAAENCCHTLHNTYSIRGTKIRDPLAWSKYLEQTIELWGDRAEVMYGMHHWPVWGRERVLEMLEKGRDGYRFINDETLRLANHGLHAGRDRRAGRVPRASWTATGRCAATTGRSTTTSRPPTSTTSAGSTATRPTCTRSRPSRPAKRYVEIMGGADAVLDKARGAFEPGDYRWVAEVVNHVVFADPDNQAAQEPPGRRARTARLPVRVRPVAQLLPHRRQGTPRRGDACSRPRMPPAPTRSGR